MQNSGAGSDLSSVACIDADHAWVVGQTGTILATTTGGRPPVLDTTPPSTSVSGADDLWHNTAVTLTLTATDNAGGSGMSGGQATTQYKIGGGSWTAGTTVVVPAPANHSGDGAQAVTFQSCDAAGNWETAKSVTVKIDTAPPTTSASGLQDVAGVVWQKQPGLVTLLAADSLSDVAATSYTIDGGLTQTYSVPFSVGGQGKHTITFWSLDNAGNTADVQTGYVNIDSKAPAATVKALSVKAAAARKGKTLKIRVTIADPKPSCGKAPAGAGA